MTATPGQSGPRHNFILDWREPARFGEYLIKAFQLNGGYLCKFYFIVNDDKKKYYKAFVWHEGKNDYIQLSKLPVPAKFMVYFLQETVRVKVDKRGQLDFISL